MTVEFICATVEVDAAESVSWQSALCDAEIFLHSLFSYRKVDKLNTEVLQREKIY